MKTVLFTALIAMGTLSSCAHPAVLALKAATGSSSSEVAPEPKPTAKAPVTPEAKCTAPVNKCSS